jgi:hypothetical protein
MVGDYTGLAGCLSIREEGSPVFSEIGQHPFGGRLKNKPENGSWTQMNADYAEKTEYID